MQETCSYASKSKVSSALSVALILIQNFQAEGIITAMEAPPLCIPSAWICQVLCESRLQPQGILITGLPVKARCSGAKSFVKGKGIILNNGHQYQLLNE